MIKFLQFREAPSFQAWVISYVWFDTTLSVFAHLNKKKNWAIVVVFLAVKLAWKFAESSWAQSWPTDFCLLNLLIACVASMTHCDTELWNVSTGGDRLISWAVSEAAGSSALVRELTLCMQQDIKSVFVVTLVHEVKKRSLVHGKIPWMCTRRPDGILITALRWLSFGAAVTETLHHSPTCKPSVTHWQHLISDLKGLCRRALGKPTSVSWTCAEAG